MLAQPACLADPAARGHLCVHPEGPDPDRLGAARMLVAAGAPVYSAGEAADGLFGIRQGMVMLAGSLPDGRRQVFAFLFPGDTFGFAADGRHSCTAVALTRTTLCRIPAEAIAADRRLAARVATALSGLRAAAWTHQLLLGRMTAAERVAAFLSGLWRRQGQPEELHLPMSVGDIADHLGIRRETVSRSLTLLRRAGLVGQWDCDGFLPVSDAAGLARAAACCKPARKMVGESGRR